MNCSARMATVLGLLIGAVTFSGCAGKTPYPVSQYQPGDEGMSCSQILSQISDNNGKIMLLTKDKDKTGKNIALGAAGIFVFPAWFFMDFSDAERIEIQAYQQRNVWLQTLVSKKGCHIIPDKDTSHQPNGT